MGGADLSTTLFAPSRAAGAEVVAADLRFNRGLDEDFEGSGDYFGGEGEAARHFAVEVDQHATVGARGVAARRTCFDVAATQRDYAALFDVRAAINVRREPHGLELGAIRDRDDVEQAVAR